MRRAPCPAHCGRGPCAVAQRLVRAAYRAASAAPVSGERQNVERPTRNTIKDRRGEFVASTGKAPARARRTARAILGRGARRNARPAVDTTLKKQHLPRDVGGGRHPWRVHIADGQFMGFCADVRRPRPASAAQCADLVRRSESVQGKPRPGMGDEGPVLARSEAALQTVRYRRRPSAGSTFSRNEVIVDRCRHRRERAS